MNNYIPKPGDKFTVNIKEYKNVVYTCQCTRNGIFSSYEEDGQVGLICFNPGETFTKYYELSSPRIVCAAIRSKNGHIVTSARHYDMNMHNMIKLMKDPEDFYQQSRDSQGFIDQHGRYYTREEAWVIAEKNGQIIREVSNPGELFSENLY